MDYRWVDKKRLRAMRSYTIPSERSYGTRQIILGNEDEGWLAPHTAAHHTTHDHPAGSGMVVGLVGRCVQHDDSSLAEPCAAVNWENQAKLSKGHDFCGPHDLRFSGSRLLRIPR